MPEWREGSGLSLSVHDPQVDTALTMIDLVWYDFYEFGVDFIDEDHKHLLSIMQAIRGAAKSQNMHDCVILLNRLVVEAGDHFRREEEFLEKADFPRLENHKAYHRKLLIQADITKRVCEGIDTEHNLQECVDHMAQFLVDDILRGDLDFKSHLEDQGYIKRRI